MDTHKRSRPASRYIVEDYDDGFLVKNRPHPVDGEGAPEWMVDLAYEYSGIRRVPVVVVRRSHHLQVEYGGTAQSMSFVDYYRLVDEMAKGAMSEWTPPDRDDGDEYHDFGPPEMHEWGGLRDWAIRRTSASLNKMIYGRWKRLLEIVDPTVLAVHRRVFSAGFGFGTTKLVESPEFYRHPYLVKDVLAYRAAAVAAGACGRSAYTEKGLAAGIDYMRDWKGLFSPSDESYPTLNKTLMNLPGGIPARILLKLRRFFLPRPITNRLELITVILANEHRGRNIPVFAFAKESDIREAIRRVANHLHADLSTRRCGDIRQAIIFMQDYPDPHRGGIVGLAERSIRWHRDGAAQRTRQTIDKLGQSTRTAIPPIALPALEGIRFLGTVGEVCAEGEAMGHCIASYAHAAVNGASYLFHVDYEGDQASVEVGWSGNVVQSYGPRNRDNKAAQWGRKTLQTWGRGLRNPGLAAPGDN